MESTNGIKDSINFGRESDPTLFDIWNATRATVLESFMKAFPSVEWAVGKDFTYKALYNECKRRKLDVQEIFTYLISTNIKDTILSTDTFGFVDDVKIKIKW